MIYAEDILEITYSYLKERGYPKEAIDIKRSTININFFDVIIWDPDTRTPIAFIKVNIPSGEAKPTDHPLIQCRDYLGNYEEKSIPTYAMYRNADGRLLKHILRVDDQVDVNERIELISDIPEYRVIGRMFIFSPIIMDF